MKAGRHTLRATRIHSDRRRSLWDNVHQQETESALEEIRTDTERRAQDAEMPLEATIAGQPHPGVGSTEIGPLDGPLDA